MSMKKFPRIGDTVILRHDVDNQRDDCGVFSGSKITGARSVKETKVLKVYGPNKVAVSSGDVWDVVPMNDGRWATGL